jgi:hypothetical protein
MISSVVLSSINKKIFIIITVRGGRGRGRRRRREKMRA